jgi:hypothetical protein
MDDTRVFHAGSAASKTELPALLGSVAAMLRKGRPVTIEIPKVADGALRGIRELLARNNIAVRLLPDSEPEAADYVAQTLFGGVAGATAGIAGGMWVLVTLARFGYLVPAVGWWISAFAVVGLAAGAAAGWSVTRFGLRVRFVRADAVELQFVPARA